LTELVELTVAMLDADTYPHDVDALELIETHLSWVFLTGAYVYKVKKPVNFDFVDFSTRALRRHFCEEEVRCNRGFAPDLYLGVAMIVQVGDAIRVAWDTSETTGNVIDYAVRMRQFDGALQADVLLENGELSVVEMRAFGRRLASQHAELPVLDLPYDPGEAMVENFATLKALPCTQPWRDEIAALEHQTEMQLAVNSGFLQRRRQEDHVRECHGDLHLSNLARLQDGITAFDCLEFDVDLRNIDVWCDAAFLFMDCAVRGRADLGYAFVDGYLDESGDYHGVELLPMFAAYRSVVRAKIAALRFEQSGDAVSRQKLATHLAWPLQQHARPTGNLYVTCGLSGSGKSYWADQLVSEIQSLRLRSDVMRKSQHGLAPLDRSESTVGGGLYASDASSRVYESLAEHAASLLSQGEHVIVDAACLKFRQREQLYAAAHALGASVQLLYFTAPRDELQSRIASRSARGGDPSEADAAVLAWQVENFEVPSADEPVIELDTTTLELARLRGLLDEPKTG